METKEWEGDVEGEMEAMSGEGKVGEKGLSQQQQPA